MIVVRTLAEAAVYAHLTGHAVVSRRSPRPSAHLWQCMWRDEARELVFVEQPNEGKSKLIDAAGFAQVGAELAATVPASPLGFVRGEAKRCIADLLLSAYAFSEALRFGDDSTLRDAREAVDIRRKAWVQQLASLPESRSLANIPLPPHGFEPPSALRDGLARPLPFPIAEIPDDLHVVARAADGRFLARHAAHTLVWLSVSPERQVTGLQLLVGRDALAALIAHGFSLLEVQKVKLRAAGFPGQAAETVLREGLGEGRDRAILELSSPAERVRFIEVETADPRLRGALLVLRIDAADRLLGLRVVEGLDGYEMMGLLDATAPHLPGPGGERPEAESADLLATSLQVIGEQVRPVLEALLDAGKSREVVASLRPRSGDAAKVFTGDTTAIDARYAELWDRDPPRIRASAAEVSLRIHVANAGSLAPGSPTHAAWPRKYDAVLGQLNPARTWVAWSYEPTNGRRGTDYDGLVWVDDHWAWFPAPDRVLGGR